MDGTRAEELSARTDVSFFGTEEPERSRKPRNRCRIFTAVLLLCLLVIVLGVVLSRTKSKQQQTDGDLWLQSTSEAFQHSQCPPGFSKPPLILVSLDGFRSEYLKDHISHMPIIHRLRNNGTSTPYMRPVYPTKTFPNHYSIVTGLYPESHGIVDNKMYDPTRNAFFSLKTEEKFNPKWYKGEPIWITAMHQKLKAGTFFWPGSDVAINGTFPNLYKKFNKGTTFQTRVSTIFEWLDLPQDTRPDFYTLYLDEPDSAGHRYGPGSSQVIEALQHVNSMMGKLMDGLTTRNLHHCANVIIVSDHGMEEASCEKASFVSDYQQHVSDFNIIQGPAARIRPVHLPEQFFSFDFEGLLKNLSCRTPDQPMRPFLKENLPKRFHFANNVMIERGHLYMKSGWQAALNRKEIKYCTGGFHGSDNTFTNMQAIFIGYGPGLKENTVVEPFENIELYNLMCDLLSIRPAPNNGTHGSLNHLLRFPLHLPVHPAQLSHDTACETTELIPSDNRQCTCSSNTTQTETDMNKLLIITDSTVKATLRRLHHPYGTPQVLQSDASFCLLHQSDYVNGYSKDRLMPLWVAYTLEPQNTLRSWSSVDDVCVRADVRIPLADSQLCARYRDDPALSYGLLHPPHLNTSGPQSDSLITSNMAPMFPAFKDVWLHIHTVLLPHYVQQLNGVNVMSGPVFDEDYDGNVDALRRVSGNEAPLPTHFFLILTSCKNSTHGPGNCAGPLQARSFILPHRPDHSESCANGSDLTWVEDWLSFHAARVRDIELLTGLSFYHDRLSVEETLQLKTFLKTS